MEKTIAEKISEFGLSLQYDDIPSEVREKAKDLILDTTGICLRSATFDFGRIVLDLVQSWGGSPESSIVGSGMKTCMHHAAFANGVLGHGLDFDDTHTESVVHPSACMVPVAMAAGEKAAASGKVVLAALIAGLEVMIRIGMPALNRFHMQGFHTTSICGTFASAVTTGKLLHLSQEELVNSLGICGSFASGLLECLSSGSWAKQLHAGWSGLCGIVSTQLAQRTYTGPVSIFEGRLGLYQSFLRSQPLDLNAIFNDIGKKWEMLNIRPKLYPCCHYLQAFLDCAAGLRKEHELDCRAIREVHCLVSEGAANIVCAPWDKKKSPETAYDMKFSLPYAVSNMLLNGRAGLNEFTLEALDRNGIRDLMAKVTYEIEPTFKVKDMPGAIRITLNDGTTLENRVAQVRGDAEHPIGREELLAKFYDNCDPVLPGQQYQAIAEQILDLEKLDDIGYLMDKLTSGAAKA